MDDLIRAFRSRKAPDRTRVVRIGVDIGQRVDPSAIAVVELEPRPVERHVSEAWDSVTADYVPSRWEVVYLLRHIERLPIGMSYPKVGERIAQAVSSVNDIVDQPGFQPVLLIDATGVGRPVIDLLRQMLRGHEYRLLAVTFTAGERLARGKRRDEIRAGKAFMVSRMQSLLQTGKLKMPETEEARALANELQDFEIRVNERANVTAGAFKTGTHDDLATALGLAVLLGWRTHPVYELLDPSDLPLPVYEDRSSD